MEKVIAMMQTLTADFMLPTKQVIDVLKDQKIQMLRSKLGAYILSAYCR
jgi:hypothetical protein